MIWNLNSDQVKAQFDSRLNTNIEYFRVEIRENEGRYIR